MRIYLASRWNNPCQKALVELLRGHGFDVYDYHQSIDPSRLSEVGHEHAEAKKGFVENSEALQMCDVCVLVCPAGRESHLELGVALGKGKNGYVLTSCPDDLELMYGLATDVYDNTASLLNELYQYREDVEDGGSWDGGPNT